MIKTLVLYLSGMYSGYKSNKTGVNIINNISEVLHSGCNTVDDVLVCREFYGAIDGLCEPTEPDSVCIQTDLFGEWGVSNDIKQQFLTGKDYSSFNGDTLEGYLNDF